jgi:putative ABC transport system permease protein
VAASVILPRLLAALSGFFGALALLLAIIGLYGTMSDTVARRRTEIGLRMALGAARTRVLGMVASEVTRLVSLGVVLGIWLALPGARPVAALLFGVTPSDPATLASGTPAGAGRDRRRTGAGMACRPGGPDDGPA